MKKLKQLVLAACGILCLCFAADSPVPPDRGIINISTLHLVSPGSPITSGFVVHGTQAIIVRAVGSGLRQFGVENALADVQVTVYRINENKVSVKLAYNDDWDDGLRPIDQVRILEGKTGAFHLVTESGDAFLFIDLKEGSYTVIAEASKKSSAANTTGLALIELYSVESPPASPRPSWALPAKPSSL